MIKRSFIIGEEWLYFKLYCGIRTADTLLVSFISPLIEKLLQERLIKQWFFLRYNDPNPHLRLRLKISTPDALGEIIALFKEQSLPFMQNNLIWRVQTDTYTRELERYGNRTIELAEKIFWHDSELIVKTHAYIDDEELHFLFILRCVSNFLDVFQLDETKRLKFYEENAKAFKEEFNVEKPTKSSLDKKYRNLKPNLEHILNAEYLAKNYEPLSELLNQRDSKTDEIAQTLLKYNAEENLEIPLFNLLGSYIHMFINKAFRDRQRFYEMVAYDFLYRHHVAICRRKHIKN